MSTPCTGMIGFSALNRAINHTAWLKSRRVSVPLGKLAGEVALIQMRANRDFLAEHPQGSDLFKLPVWKLIAREPRLVRVLLHQCMLGLRGPRSGMPIKKPIRGSREAVVLPRSPPLKRRPRRDPRRCRRELPALLRKKEGFGRTDFRNFENRCVQNQSTANEHGNAPGTLKQPLEI